MSSVWKHVKGVGCWECIKLIKIMKTVATEIGTSGLTSVWTREVVMDGTISIHLKFINRVASPLVIQAKA